VAVKSLSEMLYCKVLLDCYLKKNINPWTQQKTTVIKENFIKTLRFNIR